MSARSYGMWRAFRELPRAPAIDIGCATGEKLSHLPAGSIGVDLSQEMLCTARSKGLLCVRTDLEGVLPFGDETIQTVVCSHLLEHLASPVSALCQMNRVLKKGGTLLLGLPRESWLLEFRRPYFRGRPYHLYSFSLRNMAHLLEQTGFERPRFFFDVVKADHRPGLRWVCRLFNALPFNAGVLVSRNYWALTTKLRTAPPTGSRERNALLEEAWRKADRLGPAPSRGRDCAEGPR